MIREALIADIPTIIDIALPSWRATYPGIISEAQIAYMLDLMYSPTALREQMGQGHRFFISDTTRPAGIMAIERGTESPGKMKIHKLYIHPSEQGKGVGFGLISRAEEEAKTTSCVVLELRVNRHNPAVNFYRRVGFAPVAEVDTPFGPFVMNDYIMQRKVS